MAAGQQAWRQSKAARLESLPPTIRQRTAAAKAKPIIEERIAELSAGPGKMGWWVVVGGEESAKAAQKRVGGECLTKMAISASFYSSQIMKPRGSSLMQGCSFPLASNCLLGFPGVKRTVFEAVAPGRRRAQRTGLSCSRARTRREGAQGRASVAPCPVRS